MTQPHWGVLDGPDAAGVVQEFRRAIDREVRALDAAVPDAVQGKADAVVRYAEAWRHVVSWFLKSIRTRRPDLCRPDEDGRLSLVDARRQPAPFAAGVIDSCAQSAPFSPWVTQFGAGTGVVLYLVAEVRNMLAGVNPLPPPVGGLPPWNVDRDRFARFARLVAAELAHVDDSRSELLGLKSAFDLNWTELGRLFGVSRQAVMDWSQNGVPASRRVKLSTIRSVADLLERRLKRGRLPAVVRRPAEAYGGRSMLQAFRDDDEERVLARVRESFDWAATA